LEYLSNLGSDRAIKEALNVLPQGLEDTYEGVLRRIISNNPDRVEEIKCIFRWLIGSEYIFNLQELAEAVSINSEDTRLDPDGIVTDPEDLAALCGSLVTVNRRYDPPEISFAHYSIEEYLRSATILKSPMAEFYMDSAVVNQHLADTCLQYLSFSDFEKPLPMEEPSSGHRKQRLAQYSLLGYAANQWHRHLEKSGKTSEALDEALVTRLEWFLNPNFGGGQYKSWQQVVRSHYASIKHHKAFVLDLSVHPPLYNSIALGLDAVSAYLLNSASDIANMSSHGLTPLHAAAMQGHGSVITKLLEAGVPVNTITTDKSNRRLTALHIAAEAGHEEAVRILLAAGASPHARSIAKTTPFYKAARGGSLPVLELLYDAGSDVNVHTWDGWAPILEAINADHLPVVKRLLDWGADIEVMSNRGYTPLCVAIRANHLPMVKLLLERGANAEAKNKNGYTPLTFAKELNRDAIVELLESIPKPPQKQVQSAHNESEQAL
jgi:ankyrin repeat protein